MKRNLIIFLFTLLLGGLTCFNYSYASTVNVPESFCKKIQENYESAISSDIYNKEWISQWMKTYNENEIPQSIKDQVKNYDEAGKQAYYEAWRWANKVTSIENAGHQYANQSAQKALSSEEFKSICESNGCIHFHEKCVACPWIRLNTDIPFIGNCIPTDSQSEIFPVFIGWLIKFATSLLLLVGFICIIVGGVMVACGKDKEGKDLIKKVVYAMALLWASWVILKMINPNFFN